MGWKWTCRKETFKYEYLFAQEIIEDLNKLFNKGKTDYFITFESMSSFFLFE